VHDVHRARETRGSRVSVSARPTFAGLRGTSIWPGGWATAPGHLRQGATLRPGRLGRGPGPAVPPAPAPGHRLPGRPLGHPLDCRPPSARDGERTGPSSRVRRPEPCLVCRHTARTELAATPQRTGTAGLSPRPSPTRVRTEPTPLGRRPGRPQGHAGHRPLASRPCKTAPRPCCARPRQ
jgi:hypothetical protein